MAVMMTMGKVCYLIDGEFHSTLSPLFLIHMSVLLGDPVISPLLLPTHTLLFLPPSVSSPSCCLQVVPKCSMMMIR